jgi:hypothetical protein
VLVAAAVVAAAAAAVGDRALAPIDMRDPGGKKKEPSLGRVGEFFTAAMCVRVCVTGRGRAVGRLLCFARAKNIRTPLDLEKIFPTATELRRSKLSRRDRPTACVRIHLPEILFALALCRHRFFFLALGFRRPTR